MDQWSAALIRALDKIRPAVVNVLARTPSTGQTALGTGVILDHYHVITSAQIVAMEDEITIKTADGKRREAVCIGIDPLYFLAILRLKDRLPMAPPTFAPDGTAPTGLVVIAVGDALGQDLSASAGIISSTDRTIYRPAKRRSNHNLPVDGLILTTASIHPGNTGGPLIDLDGRVVGINGLHWQAGLSVALQASVAARVASQIVDLGYAIHPWLGFSGEADIIDQIWVDLLSLPCDRGVVVHHVSRGGPGERAGLQEEDMVMAVGGHQPVTSVGFIRKVLALHRYGEKVPLSVLRQGELIELFITVEEMPHLQDPPNSEESKRRGYN